MRLNDFIEKTICEIAQGVNQASRKSSCIVAPAFIEGKPIFEPQFIDFEVLIHSSLEGEGGIEVVTLGKAGGSFSKGESHKVNFKVPVHFNSTNPLLTGDSQKT